MSQIFLQNPQGIERKNQPRKLCLLYDEFDEVVINDDGTSSTNHVSPSEKIKRYKCSDFSISARKRAGVPMDIVTLSPSDADLDDAMRFADSLSGEYESNPSRFFEDENVSQS